ncbi:MAG: hypothetical protein HRU41_27550 [Saprospiraceae bacterium]|nr:hypothetical protein [Saprospiraceae bacterium]
MFRQRLLFSLAFLAFLLNLPASLQAEQVLVQLDKPFYTAGDPLAYQLYFPKTFQEKDLALKVAIYHPDGTLVTEHFIKTAGQLQANGYLKIPYNLPSQSYHWLLLGTNLAGDKRIKLGELLLPIYDDLSTAPIPAQLATSNPSTSIPSELSIDFQLAKNELKRGGKVEANIAIKDQAGQTVDGTLSITVKDAALLAMGTDNELSTYYLDIPEGIASQLSEDIHILGTSLNLDGSPFQSAILCAYVREENEFFCTNSDKNGHFSLVLPRLGGERHIQFMDYQRSDLKVILADRVSLSNGTSSNTSASLQTYLNWSRLRKKIYQFYGTVESPVNAIPRPIEAKELSADQRLVMAHYTPFDDLTIFFNEIVTPFKLRDRGKRGHVARMFNPTQQIRQFYVGSPVFIVDGRLTKDANFIYNIPIGKIDTIDLFFYPQSLQPQFGPIANSGMVVMKTSLNQLDLPETDVNNIFKISLLKTEYAQESTIEQTEEPIKIGPNLLWLANQSMPTSGSYQLDFEHGEDLGTFLIEIAFQSQEGKTATFTQYYEVAK